MFGIASLTAFAEASFDQIETLIQQKNYSAAASGLETIIQNHPKSAKAFYAMAQAQAGLGNLEKAQKALDIATGLNPSLDFAPASSVQKLKQAITPQTVKIESIEESHTVRNTILVIFVLAAGFVGYTVYRRKQEEEEAAREKAEAELKAERQARDAESKRKWQEMVAQQEAERKATLEAEAALRAHKNYGKPGFDPANPDKLKTKAQLKKEADEAARIEAEAEARRQRIRAEAAEDEARRARSYNTSQPTTVVNNSGGNDMLTGVLIGNMLSSSHHSHDTERTVVRETVREVPAPSRDSSWDDTPSRSSSSSRSSSWDDDSSSSSSKSSSSWSSSSDSSSSSSSWDSSSSSSDSGSSSSWD